MRGGQSEPPARRDRPRCCIEGGKPRQASRLILALAGAVARARLSRILADRLLVQVAERAGSSLHCRSRPAGPPWSSGSPARPVVLATRIAAVPAPVISGNSDLRLTITSTTWSARSGRPCAVERNLTEKEKPAAPKMRAKPPPMVGRHDQQRVHGCPVSEVLHPVYTLHTETQPVLARSELSSELAGH